MSTTLTNPSVDVQTTFVLQGKEVRNQEGTVTNAKTYSIAKGATAEFEDDVATHLLKRFGFLKKVTATGETEKEPVLPEEVPEITKEVLIDRQLDPTLTDELHSPKNKDLRLTARAKYGKTFKVGTRNQEIIDYLNGQETQVTPNL